MKTNVVIVVIIASLLTTCTPAMPAQEIEVTNHVPTEVSFTEAAMTPVLVVTEEPTATATEAPGRTKKWNANHATQNPRKTAGLP